MMKSRELKQKTGSVNLCIKLSGVFPLSARCFHYRNSAQNPEMISIILYTGAVKRPYYDIIEANTREGYVDISTMSNHILNSFIYITGE